MEEIRSKTNIHIKEVRELLSGSSKRRKNKAFIAEGERLCREIPEKLLKAVYISETYKGSLPCVLAENSRKIPVFRVSDTLMEYMSDTESSQGILCIAGFREEKKPEGRFFIILENLQDPGNLGTIFRTAEAGGIDGIIMTRGCCDVYSPKVIRSAMGSVFRMPFFVTDDLSGLIKEYKDEGVSFFAAHLKGKKKHYEADLTHSFGIIIGNEGNGITDETAALCDELIRIPMKGRTESLNASIAGAVLIYEALRQRSILEEEI